MRRHSSSADSQEIQVINDFHHVTNNHKTGDASDSSTDSSNCQSTSNITHMTLRNTKPAITGKETFHESMDDLTPVGKKRSMQYHPRENRGPIILVFVLNIIGQILVNFDSGAIPAVINIISEEFDFSTVELGILGGLPYVGLIIACCFVGNLIQTTSQKILIVISVFSNSASAALLACSYYRGPLYASRFLLGFTQSVFCIYSPVWIDEFAPEAKLAFWMSGLQGSSVFGVMVGYSITGFVAGATGTWRWPLGGQAIGLAVLSVLFFFTPSAYIDIYASKKSTKDEMNLTVRCKCMRGLRKVRDTASRSMVSITRSICLNKKSHAPVFYQIESRQSMEVLSDIFDTRSNRTPSHSIVEYDKDNSNVLPLEPDKPTFHSHDNMRYTTPIPLATNRKLAAYHRLQNSTDAVDGYQLTSAPDCRSGMYNQMRSEINIPNPIDSSNQPFESGQPPLIMALPKVRRAPTFMTPSPAGAVFEGLEISALFDDPLVFVSGGDCISNDLDPIRGSYVLTGSVACSVDDHNSIIHLNNTTTDNSLHDRTTTTSINVSSNNDDIVDDVCTRNPVTPIVKPVEMRDEDLNSIGSDGLDDEYGSNEIQVLASRKCLSMISDSDTNTNHFFKRQRRRSRNLGYQHLKSKSESYIGEANDTCIAISTAFLSNDNSNMNLIPTGSFGETDKPRLRSNVSLSNVEVKRSNAKISNDGFSQCTFVGPKLTTMKQLKMLYHNPIYIWVVVTLSSLLFVVTAIQYWSTIYFTNVLNVPLKTALLGFSVTAATAPVVGVLFGGFVVDKMGGYRTARGVTKTLTFCTVSAAVSIIAGIIPCTVNNFPMVIGALWVLLFGGGSTLPSLVGILVAIVDPRIRPFASGLSMLIYNIFGYSLGSFLPGVIMKLIGFALGMKFVFLMGIFTLLGLLGATTSAWRYQLRTSKCTELALTQQQLSLLSKIEQY